MPAVTVSMPAYNSGKYIKEAIESVLRQDSLDFELIVVDDASCDNTAEIVLSFRDPRIRLIRNKKNMGIGYCHNLVIKHSQSPFIAHVDSDDLIVPGALEKMLTAIKSDSHTGQVHCYFFDIDEAGIVTREKFRVRRRRVLETRPAHMDYEQELLVHGTVINALRTYRKEIFDQIGYFNDQIRYDVDYEMAVRILDQYDIKLVPEFLYVRRIHKGNTTESLPFRSLRFFVQRVVVYQHLLKRENIRFLKRANYSLIRLASMRLYYSVGLAGVLIFTTNTLRKFIHWIICRILDPMARSIYNAIDDHFSFWPVNLFSFKRQKRPKVKKRIAYYLWHYPVLSQTFIQRELIALKASNLWVKIVADAADDLRTLDEHTKALANETHYLYPIHKKHLLTYFRYFLCKNPLLLMNLFLYVMFHRYQERKNIYEDLVIFLKGVYLAGLLKDMHVNHIHSPWTDVNAFVALIASKLLGLPYTVQARAHDVHRKSFCYALPEKLANAEFIVTNCHYNEFYLKSVLHKRHWEKIHTIYEGVNLREFEPKKERELTSKEIRILSVARLIEQKGLTYLLKACRILKDRGYLFKCEIIGGPEKPLYMNYYVTLQKLHRHLRLEDCVFFLGAQPFSKALERYQDADIFVLPCILAGDGSRDITPNVLIEAMAMKLPIIATNITGIPEIVDDLVNGLLVPPCNEEALVQAILTLMKDAHFRKQLGENARKKVEQVFDIEKNIIQYVHLFGAQMSEAVKRPARNEVSIA